MWAVCVCVWADADVWAASVRASVRANDVRADVRANDVRANDVRANDVRSQTGAEWAMGLRGKLARQNNATHLYDGVSQ